MEPYTRVMGKPDLDSRSRKILRRVLTFVGLGILLAVTVLVVTVAISRTGLH